METRARKQETLSVNSPAGKVLGLDLLREMILDYVIHEGNEVLVSNVRSCRLVSKAWLSSTSRVLFKSKEPLFRFNLSIVKKRSGSGRDGKFLREFLRIGAEKLITGENIPLHSISVLPYYSKSKNEPCQAVSNALEICGGSLLKLNFCSTYFWRPMPLSTQVQLPRLETFTVHLPHRRTPPVSERYLNDNVDFIQSVFTATEQLKSFRFRCALHQDLWTNGFGDLQFPASLTELDIQRCRLNDYSFEALVKNDFPNLKTLKFTVNRIPFRDGLITSALQNVRKTLQSLYVYGDCWDGGIQNKNSFQFPLMEKLESIVIETMNIELKENSSSSSLQPLVPLLTHLTFGHQLVTSIRKWIERLHVIDSVYSLNVFWTLDLATIAAIRKHFPNLREMNLTFSRLDEVQIDVLKFIVAEMGYLRRLCIYTSVSMYYLKPKLWVELLTGIPKEEISNLKDSPESWKRCQIGSNPCILNWTDLHTLQLETGSFSILDDPIITKEVFHYVFFKMPNLKKLVLKGGFSATGEMAKQWREDGRTIETECWRYPDSDEN